MEPEVYWDSRSSRYRYRDTNRFVSRIAVNAIAARQVKASTDKMSTLTDSMISGEISFLQWQLRFAEELRSLHTRQAALSKGGVDKMQDGDWLAIANILREEYRYFRNFATDIKSGNLSELAIKSRSRLYTKRAVLSGEKMRQIVEISKGNTQMQRFLGATDRHCEDCLNYAAMGVVSIGGLPLPTQQCQCRANCKCRVVYLP